MAYEGYMKSRYIIPEDMRVFWWEGKRVFWGGRVWRVRGYFGVGGYLGVVWVRGYLGVVWVRGYLGVLWHMPNRHILLPRVLG